jgi:anti-repressor protein
MNELQIFKNPEFGEVRTLEENGEVLFCGSDVAKSLGYTNPSKALSDHCRGVTKRYTPTKSGEQEMSFIPESDLYRLVFGSKLPTAEKFTDWVTSEVLPTVRKHGAYMTLDTLDRMIASPEFGIKLLSALQEEREQRANLESKVEADAPKVLFADAVSASKTSILVGELAKLLKQNGVDIGQHRLFRWMRENGYLIRRNGTDFNMPTQKSMDLGLFTVKETAITHSDGTVTVSKTTKVTGKGQQYFIQKFLGEEGARK